MNIGGGGIDFSLFLFLHYKLGLHYGIAAFYAFLVAASLGFLALKYLVFKERKGSISLQYAKHGAAILNTLIMMEILLWLGVDFLHWPAWGVKLIAYGCTTSLNFTLSKFMIFTSIR